MNIQIDKLSKVTTIATVTFLSLGLITTHPAIAREMTTEEAIPLTSTLEGFNSVIAGLGTLQAFDSGTVADWSTEYTSSGSTLSAIGTINGSPLNLNYSGTLSGQFGVEDLTWTGNWTGSLGNTFISATDSATFFYDSQSSGYGALDFAQDGILNTSSLVASRSLFNYFVRGTEVLGGITVGIGVGVSTRLVRKLNFW